MTNRYGDEGYGRFPEEDERSWHERSKRHGDWGVGLIREAWSGKAPKGYTRADERIREDICDRLMLSPYDCSEVEVTVAAGEVTLTGTVSSRADKWGIEDVAEVALGVQHVNNQIRVNRDESHRTTLAGDTGHLHS